MAQQRKILILTNRVPYPLKDGGNLAMNAMIEGYHSAGWQVYLLSMNTTRHHVAGDVLSRIYRDIEGFEVVNVDNKITTGGTLKNLLFSSKPNHAERFENKEFEDKILQVIDVFKPDVIQIESVFLSSYIHAIRRRSNALLILRMHNIEYQIWGRLGKKTGNFLSKLYYKNLSRRMKEYERQAWKKYDLLLPITESDANMVERMGVKTKQVITPFGIDVSNIAPGTGQEKWNGFHIGAMDWRPNQEAIKWFLGHVWPKLHKAAPEFEFHFAGRHMPDYFKNLNLPNVFCAGEVEDAEQFIADKKILIVPLRSGGGIRVKILEAMAAGKVIISTKVGMQGIDARSDTHYLHVHATKSDEYVKAVKWCLHNKAEAEEMGREAQKLVRSRYSQTAIIANIIKEIERILSPDPDY